MAFSVDDYLRAARTFARRLEPLLPRLREESDDLVLGVHTYAWLAFEAFVRAYHGDGRNRIAVLSMNPGRNGAVQTGIAFTDGMTARELLPEFDDLVPKRPFVSERREISGLKLREWARRHLGGLQQLYRDAMFPITFPAAVLRGPSRVNVPLPSLRPDNRRLVEAFLDREAPALLHAAQPRGVLLLGDWAARNWARYSQTDPELARLPVAETYHPAAHITNARKYGAWMRAWTKVQRDATRRQA